MAMLIAALVSACLLAAVFLGLGSLTRVLSGRKQERGASGPAGGGTSGQRTCILCSSVLGTGERIHSSIFPGKADRIMHIYGCSKCWPAGRSSPGVSSPSRICPVCGRALEAEGFLIARCFERPSSPSKSLSRALSEAARPRTRLHILPRLIRGEGMDTTQIKKYGMVAVFLGLFVLVSMIYLPFLTVFIWSGLFYAFLSPLYKRLTRHGERGSLACKGIAGLLAVGSVLLIAVPGVILGITIVKQLSSIVQQTLASIEANPKMVNSLGNGPIGSFLSAISGGSIDLATTDIGNAVRHFLASRTNQILGLSGKIIKDSLGIVVNLVFMIFTLFFFLIDGQHLMRILIGALPIEKRYTIVFLGKFRDMGRQLVIGYILIALLQALIMVTLCLIFSVKGGILIGFLTALASFIPMIGTALVWLPISAAMFVAGDLTGAVLFFVLSAALIWTTDNLLRPLLLHGRLKIHPLLILFSILGGLRVFKFNGLVLGPLILILFFAAVELNEKDEIEASRERPGSVEGPEGEGH